MKQVICGYCEKHIYNFTGDHLIRITKTDNVYEFEGVNGFLSPRLGDPLMCPNCQRGWGTIFGTLFTETDDKIILGKQR